MTQPPSLRGIPGHKILEARPLSDGKWLFKISNRKGAGDFRVTVFDPHTKRRTTPSYAHFAIDLFGKLSRSEETASLLLRAIEEVYSGSKAPDVLAKLKAEGKLQQFAELPGYSAEYTLNALEFIFAQEELTWERDFVEKARPLPQLRRTLIRGGFLNRSEAENKGSAIAMHLLRRVVSDKVHPVEAMREVGLRIVAGYG